MAKKIPYYATRDAIFKAGEATDFFTYGAYSDPAALCAEMARVAYVKEEDRARDYLGKLDFTLIYFVPTDAGTQGFIARKGDVVVIAFRGTEPDDRRDILTDLDLPRVRWPEGGTVHSGFADGLNEAWAAFEAHLPTDAPTLYVTGHSLGAALATLAASRLKDRSSSVFTFGAPLVGNARFGKTIPDERHHRYMNCLDLVTRIPPEFLGFVHCGTRHYIDSDGKIHARISERAIERDTRDARIEYMLKHSWRRGTVELRELADHAPINYVSALLGNRGKKVEPLR